MTPGQAKQRKVAIVGSRSVGKCRSRNRIASRSSDEAGIAGKSSLTVQYVEGHFVESYYPTIENTFSKIISFKGEDFATEIVDTAGQVSRHMRPVKPTPAGCRVACKDDANRARMSIPSLIRSTLSASTHTCSCTRLRRGHPLR